MINNKTILAIIPVRGGSKGITRKNARLLAGKPLMSYVIEAAKKTGVFDEIAVSTDDRELAHIAQSLGCRVLGRKPELAGDSAGLDEVICDAVRLYEKESGNRPDYIATLQATSPFLRQETILSAVTKCINGGLDTILSVTDDRHLTWTVDRNGAFMPEYQKRLNRQLLPARYRETGGIVVCTRDQALQGTRFGKKTDVVVCDRREALDIDESFDWWTAEKSLSRKKIVFRTEGYDEIGLGHVYRCLALADYTCDHDFEFIMSTRSVAGIEVVRNRYYPLVTFEPELEKEIAAIYECKPDILINDKLDTTLEYMKKIKMGGFRVVNFEDLGIGAAGADAVINEMYDDQGPSSPRNIYSGVNYVCLRDEFYNCPPIAINTSVKNILLLFGGTDPSGLTRQTLEWLMQSDNNFAITVIVGPGNRDLDLLKKMAVNSGEKVSLHWSTPIISRYMAGADVAVTSAGRTVFELASLGIPMVVICQNERETKHHFARESTGVINIGMKHDLTYSKFIDAVNQIVASPLLRGKMQEALIAADLRSGIRRVWKIILGEE